MEQEASQSSVSQPNNNKREIKFHVVRMISYFLMIFLNLIVAFQKQVPSTLAEDISKTYAVPISSLGIYSSVYFYPYAAIQPFAGLLVDIVDPAFVAGTGMMVASIGTVICGLSSSLSVGIFGRLLVGLGCGPIFVSITRTITNWFELSLLPTMLGICISFGGAGGILSAGPTAAFVHVYTWRYVFYGVGGIGIIFSLLILIFVRGNPVTKGFKPVNAECDGSQLKIPFKERLSTLWSNFKIVVWNPYFWLIAVFNFCSSGPFFDTAGYWSGPYLVQILGYTSQKKGSTLISFSIGVLIGSFSIPSISTLCKTRKWVMFASSAISCVIFLVFTFIGEHVSIAVVWVLHILIGIFTNPLTSVSYPLVREYYHPSVAGAAVGCSNIFTFLASAIFQQVSSKIIPLGGKIQHSEDEVWYTWKGYKNGLYLFGAISLAVSALSAAITKDSEFAKKEEKKEETDDSIQVNDVEAKIDEEENGDNVEPVEEPKPDPKKQDIIAEV